MAKKTKERSLVFMAVIAFVELLAAALTVEALVTAPVPAGIPKIPTMRSSSGVSRFSSPTRFSYFLVSVGFPEFPRLFFHSSS